MDEKLHIKQILKRAKEHEEMGSFVFGVGIVTIVFTLIVMSIPSLRTFIPSRNTPEGSNQQSQEQPEQVKELTQLPLTPQLYEKEGKLYSPYVPAKYVVKQGDFTWGIAERIYGSGESYREIELANLLAPNSALQAGQELLLPNIPSLLTPPEYKLLFPTEVSVTPLPTPAATPALINLEGKRFHTVSKSQGLWQIAQAYYGDGNQYLKIFEANKDKMRTPDDIKEGMELLIP